MTTAFFAISPAFQPLGVNTPLAATSTSAATAMRTVQSRTLNGTSTSFVDNPGAAVRVTNPSTTVTAYARVGVAGVVATTADVPIPPSSSAVIQMPGQTTHVAVILDAAGPVTIGLQLGTGSPR